MPRQRIYYSRRVYDFPGDFPERLERFRVESGLSWAELNRRLGVHDQTVRRWRKGSARPSTRHMMALLDLAGGMGLRRLFDGEPDTSER
ncbi:MAG: helix-turn-helix transcriptional regulator [Chloroflexota bacterium]|nr:helix-turn-helix transcriptional regulator [Chloroflexota bacterium]MDE2884810.1 helix-turn-helix transcriptional regulator [Chloroflexota bacterium]